MLSFYQHSIYLSIYLFLDAVGKEPGSFDGVEKRWLRLAVGRRGLACERGAARCWSIAWLARPSMTSK